MVNEQTTNLAQCSSCSTRVSNKEDAIECEYCHKWQHFECCGLTKGEFDVMKRKNCKLTWLCSECKPKLLCMNGIEERVTTNLSTQMKTIMESMMEGIQEAIKTGIKSASTPKVIHRTDPPPVKSRAPKPNQPCDDLSHEGNGARNLIGTDQSQRESSSTLSSQVPCEESDPRQQNVKWTEVVKRVSQRIIGTKDNTRMMAAPRKAWLYVGRLHEETRAESIIAHLQEGGIMENVTCEEIDTRGRNKAFKVSFNFDDLEKTKDPYFWPRNVIIRPYRFPRRGPGLIPTTRTSVNSQ